MARPTDKALANLRRIDAMTPEEKTAFTRKGQAAGAEVRRRKRALRDVLDALLSMEYTGSTDSALAEAAQSARGLHLISMTQSLLRRLSRRRTVTRRRLHGCVTAQATNPARPSQCSS